ncbi:MAG: hypothetical protein NTU83_12370, partial [Candidatus Hydrogenedentes bacterium]|nr:hypothetical protein [Candidatus Hydrogenedentota bacterium]
MAQLKPDDKQPLNLGKDTNPPHGGIDTCFKVGKAKGRMEPWTDAPLAINRGPRTLKRTLAFPGDTAIWTASSMEKIFREDIPESDGRFDPMVRVSLARNERESFQIVVRPSKDRDLHRVTFKIPSLVHRGSGQPLGPDAIRIANVGYVPIRVPSQYEGPTGEWPDPLPPFASFTAPGERCSPTWFTVYAPPKAPAGVYTGHIAMSSDEAGEVVLPIEVTVYDFDLPVTPALKTDFGFRPDLAVRDRRARTSRHVARSGAVPGGEPGLCVRFGALRSTIQGLAGSWRDDVRGSAGFAERDGRPRKGRRVRGRQTHREARILRDSVRAAA